MKKTFIIAFLLGILPEVSWAIDSPSSSAFSSDHEDISPQAPGPNLLEERASQERPHEAAPAAWPLPPPPSARGLEEVGALEEGARAPEVLLPAEEVTQPAAFRPLKLFGRPGGASYKDLTKQKLREGKKPHKSSLGRMHFNEAVSPADVKNRVRQARQAGAHQRIESITDKKIAEVLVRGAKVKHLSLEISERDRKTFKALGRILGQKSTIRLEKINEEFVLRTIEQAFRNQRSQMESLEIDGLRVAAVGERPQDLLPPLKGQIYHPKNLKSLSLGSKQKPLEEEHFSFSKWLPEGSSQGVVSPIFRFPLKRLSLCMSFSQGSLLTELQALPWADCLQSLNLSGKDFPYLSDFSSSLPHFRFPKLEEFRMDEINFRTVEGGLKEFFPLEGCNVPHLKILHFSGCGGIKGSDIFHLFHKIPSLVELRIENCWTDEFAPQEEEGFERLSADRRVRLSIPDNRFSSREIGEILSRHQLCDNLEYLNLKGNFLWEEQEKIFERACPFLTELNLEDICMMWDLEPLTKRKDNFPLLSTLNVKHRWNPKSEEAKYRKDLEDAFPGIKAEF